MRLADFKVELELLASRCRFESFDNGVADSTRCTAVVNGAGWRVVTDHEDGGSEWWKFDAAQSWEF